MDNEVYVIPFKYKHLELLYDMLEKRQYLNISLINMKTLPKIGYIALLNHQPIAAGFLRRVEGGYAQIDCLTSNPYFGSQVRNEGISKVIDNIIEEAKVLGLHGILGFTEDFGVLQRAKSLGFQVVEQTLIGLRLDTGSKGKLGRKL